MEISYEIKNGGHAKISPKFSNLDINKTSQVSDIVKLNHRVKESLGKNISAKFGENPDRNKKVLAIIGLKLKFSVNCT